MDDGSKKEKNVKEQPERGNTALFCSICLKTTELLEKSGVTAVRVETQNDRTLCLCEPCLTMLQRKLYTEDRQTQTRKAVKNLTVVRITPQYIYDQLSRHVIGQESAKRSLSVAVALHLKRTEGVLHDKSNVLLLGPTGTGKTEIARSISKLLNLPLVVYDCTTLTAHGYVGEDVESVLQMLLMNAGGDVKLAEKGIVFLDEFDKLAIQSGDYGVNTSAVQQSLLKMIEGGKVKVPKAGSKKDGEFVTIDTSKILFVCAGAFSGLESIIQRDLGSGRVGLRGSSSVNEDASLDSVETKHLIKFGIIPELLGRLPMVTSTSNLSKEQLVSVLKEPENSLLKYYQNAFQSYGFSVEFEKAFLDSVAEEAFSSNLGARGLRKILETRLMPLLFEAPSKYPAFKRIVIGTSFRYKK